MNIEFENKLDIEEMKAYLKNTIKDLGNIYFEKLNEDIQYPLSYTHKISGFNRDYILNKISNMQNIEDVLNVLQLIYQLNWENNFLFRSFFINVEFKIHNLTLFMELLQTEPSRILKYNYKQKLLRYDKNNFIFADKNGNIVERNFIHSIVHKNIDISNVKIVLYNDSVNILVPYKEKD